MLLFDCNEQSYHPDISCTTFALVLLLFINTTWKYTHNSGSGSITYDIIPDEELEVSIYTRSNAGAEWTVSDAKNKRGTTWVSGIETKHVGDDLKVMPTHVKLTKANIKGPCSIEVKAKSHGGRWTTEKFLVVVSVFKV